MDFAVGKDHTSHGLSLRPCFQLIGVNGDILAVLEGRSRQVQEGLRAFPLNQLNSNPPGNWAIERWDLGTVNQFLRHEQGDLAPVRLANHNSVFDAELPRINPATQQVFHGSLSVFSRSLYFSETRDSPNCPLNVNRKTKESTAGRYRP
jgi:hypothetical protein